MVVTIINSSCIKRQGYESITTGIIVSISGFIISSILVINYKNLIFQQSIFLISSSIIIVSPIIFSLGYFIVLGEFNAQIN